MGVPSTHQPPEAGPPARPREPSEAHRGTSSGAPAPEQAYAPLKELLLGMAAERSLDGLLARITTTLAEQPEVVARFPRP